MKLRLILILLIASGHLFAQDLTQTVRGSLKDKQTYQPLIGAKIIVVGTEPLIGAVSDIDGKFRLEKVPVGRQQIAISYHANGPRV